MLHNPAPFIRSCPPSANFTAAGQVTRAFFSDTPPSFARRPAVRGRRAQGVRYEREVQAMLESLLGSAYTPSPWLCFNTGESLQTRWCQPDGLLFDAVNARITIIEVKYQHTSDAWWQVERLYRPVIEFLFPTQAIQRLEIVKWFDPETPFPEPVVMCESPARFSGSAFGVHIWKPGDFV